MKKILKLLSVFILLLIVWIGIDRYINITPYYAEGYTTMIQIDDSIWTNIPEGKWFNIDNKVFKPMNSTQYVEHFNPILRTWKNVRGANYTYHYRVESGQPFILRIFERSIDFDHEFESGSESLQSEIINGVEVSYGVDNGNSYIIKFKNEECEIIVITNQYNLSFFKPTLQDILNQLQK